MIWKVKSLKPFPWEPCNLLFQLRGTKYSRKRRWVERRPWRWLLACRGLYSLLGLPLKKKKKKKVRGFPGGLFGKESACNVGDLGSIPELGRSPGGGYGNPLQYSCLENLHGQRSLVGCSPWSLKESDTTEQLNWTELNAGSFLCKSASLEFLYVSKFPPYKDTSQIGWRLTLMTLS